MAGHLNVQITDDNQIVYRALQKVVAFRGKLLYKVVFELLTEHPDIKAEIGKIKNARIK